MLDENLPAFFYKKSPDGLQHHDAIYLSYQGSDPSPAYILKHADPSKQASQNCYAAALFDSFNPDVLFGEVLVQPTWTQPNLSQEDIRRNGGIPPPPQAIIPGDFSIQLYEPDQQVVVRRKLGSLGISTTYEFDMPQTTFRTPSVSALDRTQSDPSATATTPKLNFVWRKESKLSKDLTCFLTGKSTDGITKKKHKDPDIAIALFRSLREITIYEPNLSRVDLEDLKGLEVVILLAAATIKDIYLGNNLKEVFNITEGPTRKLSSGGRKVVPAPPPTASPPTPKDNRWVPTTVSPNFAKPPQPVSRPSGQQNTGKDARAQWEIDNETARLKAQVAVEQKEDARRAAQRKREKEKADEAETRRLRKMVEAEARQAEKKQKAIDEETQRLRRKYGQNLPQLPVRPGPSSAQARPPPPPPMHPQGGFLQPVPQGQPGRPGMYNHPNKSTSAAPNVFMSGGAGPSGQAPAPRPRKSGFFGLRELEDEMKKVSKKRSSIW